MNNKYLTFFRSLLFSGFIIVVLTFLTGCENFLKGNDVKSQLEDLIAYENALTHQLIVRADPAMGSFLSDGEKPCKLGFTTDLQFTMNTEDYFFHGFEAVCVNDTSQSRADCVEFTINESESDPSKGIYKVTVKLLKAADDILIRPVCVLIPAVVSYEPESKSPNYMNTQIHIHFNKSMNPLNVLEKDQNGKYKNISIMYSGEDILDMFEVPFLDSSKTNLTFIPKGGELMEKFKDETFSYFDFDISLKNISVLETVSGKDYNLALKNNNSSGYSFIVRYKCGIETEHPIQYAFKATRHEITLENAANLEPEKEFIYGELDASENGDPDKIFANRTNGTIYIYGKFYDAESGVRAVVVEEHRIYDSQNDYIFVNAKGEEDKRIHYYISDENENATWIDSNDGYVTFLIKHKMESFNGAVVINVNVIDCAGNPQAEKNADNETVYQTFTVFKKDGSDFSNRDRYWFALYNGGCINELESSYLLDKYSSSESFNLVEYNEKIREIFLVSEKCNYGLCQLYQDVMYSPSDLKIQCKYINSNKKEVTQDFIFLHEDYDNDSLFWGLTLDVEKIGGSKLTLIVCDDIGNKMEVEYRIPESNDFSYAQKDDTVEFFSSSEYQVSGLFYVESNSNAQYYCYHYADPYLYPNDYVVISLNNNCKICPRFDLYYGSFFVEISDVNYNGASSSGSLNISLGNCSVLVQKAAHDSSGHLNVIASIPEDSWSKFDSIYVDFSKLFYIPEYYTDGSRCYFEKGKNYTTANFNNELLYDEDDKIICTFYGIKDNLCIAEVPVEIQPVSGPDYDNDPPDYNVRGFSFTNQKVTFVNIDDNSGPGDSIVFINGEKQTFKEQLELNLKDINLSPEGSFDYEVHVYDMVGNSFFDLPRTFLAQQAAVTSIENKGTTWTLTCPGYGKNKKLYIYTLNSDGSWSDPDIKTMALADLALNKGYKNVTLPEGNNFIKIIHTDGDETTFSYPAYFYTGGASDGIHDFVMSHGKSQSEVLVTSNKPVFVNTAVTNLDYEICKNWTAGQWEFCRDTIGNKYLDFTEVPYAYQKYEIPIAEITSGQCYCVIAHFANGDTDMSDVFQMP